MYLFNDIFQEIPITVQYKMYLKVYYPYWIKIWTIGISYTYVWN